MATSLEKSKKKLNEVNKPLHPSTNPEILVKIGPLGYELPSLEHQPLKNKNKEKNTGKIYSPFSMFAERAKQIHSKFIANRINGV